MNEKLFKLQAWEVKVTGYQFSAKKYYETFPAEWSDSSLRWALINVCVIAGRAHQNVPTNKPKQLAKRQ